MNDLNVIAEKISKQFRGEPPVIIVVGGIGELEDDKEPKGTIFGFYKAPRLRERIGILQAAIQWDSYYHYRENEERVKKEKKGS